MGYDSACTAPTPALPKAMPPSMAPMAMLCRASTLVPSSTAVRRLAVISSIPSRASGSVCSVALTEMNASMLWISASMPAAAVMPGGHDIVSIGSTMAMSGIRCGLTTPCFTFFFSFAKMAMAVTSEPVPAVVGTAISGSPFLGTMSTPTYSSTECPVWANTAVILATSMAEPPPKPTMRS